MNSDLPNDVITDMNYLVGTHWVQLAAASIYASSEKFGICPIVVMIDYRMDMCIIDRGFDSLAICPNWTLQTSPLAGTL